MGGTNKSGADGSSGLVVRKQRQRVCYTCLQLCCRRVAAPHDLNALGTVQRAEPFSSKLCSAPRSCQALTS